jgi:hypothetical protein
MGLYKLKMTRLQLILVILTIALTGNSQGMNQYPLKSQLNAIHESAHCIILLLHDEEFNLVTLQEDTLHGVMTSGHVNFRGSLPTTTRLQFNIAGMMAEFIYLNHKTTDEWLLNFLKEIANKNNVDSQRFLTTCKSLGFDDHDIITYYRRLEVMMSDKQLKKEYITLAMRLLEDNDQTLTYMEVKASIPTQTLTDISSRLGF